jgi:hypothetical protein
MNSITQESLELMKGALAQPDFRLAKSISTATGLLAFDLQAPAKNLYPFVTPPGTSFRASAGALAPPQIGGK